MTDWSAGYWQSAFPPLPSPLMGIRTSAPIAVVGAGTMGMGIALLAASAGHKVTVLDTNETALNRAQTTSVTYLDSAIEKGRLTGPERQAIERRLCWSGDLASASEAALVIEAIVEDIGIKQELFSRLVPIVARDALLASNTSSLSIRSIAAPHATRDRFLGLHFFNPVPAMKLVEIVSGPETDPACVDAVFALMRSWGKNPVRVRDVPGFIVNRVARPYYAEGFLALQEGIHPVTIDTALSEAGGFRMGPLALADMIGHDVNYAVATSVFEAGVGIPRFRPQPTQLALVERQWLGRKAGRGVYDHSRVPPGPRYIEARDRPSIVCASDPGLLEPLVAAASAAGIAVASGTPIARESIDVDGVRIALGDGRSLAHRPGVDVLMDHTRDFRTAETIVISARSPAEAQIAAAFLRAIDRKVLVVPDRPGQLVLRVLAQIANAAADTVADNIASIEDVETAMLFGANHPEGPIAWAERVGLDVVRNALADIARETGDAIYQPSAMFGRS